MDSLTEEADDPLFKLHFQSMKKVVLDKGYLSATDLSFVSATLEYFYDIYSFRRPASTSPSIAYQDGFELAMWGRGNYWYEGISETDIWEGIDVIEKLFKIDRYRKYITSLLPKGMYICKLHAEKETNFSKIIVE